MKPSTVRAVWTSDVTALLFACAGFDRHGYAMRPTPLFQVSPESRFPWRRFAPFSNVWCKSSLFRRELRYVGPSSPHRLEEPLPHPFRSLTSPSRHYRHRRLSVPSDRQLPHRACHAFTRGRGTAWIHLRSQDRRFTPPVKGTRRSIRDAFRRVLRFDELAPADHASLAHLNDSQRNMRTVLPYRPRRTRQRCNGFLPARTTPPGLPLGAPRGRSSRCVRPTSATQQLDSSTRASWVSVSLSPDFRPMRPESRAFHDARSRFGVPFRVVRGACFFPAVRGTTEPLTLLSPPRVHR
jgi:hypothetical protein